MVSVHFLFVAVLTIASHAHTLNVKHGTTIKSQVTADDDIMGLNTDKLAADGGGCSPGDDPCFECFECNSGGRCVPIDGCVPHCYSDDDCTRNQICNHDMFCELPGGAPKDSSSMGSGRGSHSGGSGSRSDRGSGSRNSYKHSGSGSRSSDHGLTAYGSRSGSHSGGSHSGGSHSGGSGSRDSRGSGSRDHGLSADDVQSDAYGHGCGYNDDADRGIDKPCDDVDTSGDILTADTLNHHCMTKYDCVDPQICNNGVCELAPRSAEDARMRSQSGSASHGSHHSSGHHSSSRRSGSRSRSHSASSSRDYNGHGLGLETMKSFRSHSAKLRAFGVVSDDAVTADGQGYECSTKYDCADPQICNDGICELAPRSVEDARSRSHSGSGSSSRGSHSGGSGSRDDRGSSSRRSSSRNYGDHSGSHSVSAEEMQMLIDDVVIGSETLEVESSHLDIALVIAGMVMMMFLVYHLYRRCVMQRAAKEMNAATGGTAHERSSHAVVNGQVVY